MDAVDCMRLTMMPSSHMQTLLAKDIRRCAYKHEVAFMATKSLRGAHNVEGAEGTTATQHKSCAAESMAGLPQEVQLVFQSHVWTIIGCDTLQMLLHLLNILPDGLWHCGEVLMQLTAMEHSIFRQTSSRVMKCDHAAHWEMEHLMPNECTAML